MSLINNLITLRTEDFDKEQSWLARLFVQVNPLIQSIGSVVNGGIDFTSNIKSVTKDYTISIFQPIQFQWPFKDTPPIDLRVTQALKGSQNTPTVLLAAWNYDATQTLITVSQLLEVTTAGVTPITGQYKFKLRVNI